MESKEMYWRNKNGYCLLDNGWMDKGITKATKKKLDCSLVFSVFM